VRRRRHDDGRHNEREHSGDHSLFDTDHVSSGDCWWQNAGTGEGAAMTADANPLTARATALTPTMSDVRVTVRAFERLGFDVAAMLAAARLTPAALAEREGPITLEECEGLFCEAARQRTVPNLPLRLASEVPLGSYPLLDYLVLSSAKGCAGCRSISRWRAMRSRSTWKRDRTAPGSSTRKATTFPGSFRLRCRFDICATRRISA